MIKTQRYSLIALRSLLLCLVCVSAIESASAQIAGRWRSLETSRGGVGEMYEFHPNGVVDYSLGAVVDISWRIEANQLVLPSDTVNGPERRQTIHWLNPNKLRLGSENDLKQELTRVGEPSNVDDPILGEWTGIEDMDGRKLEFHWFFYAAGKGLFLLPFATQHGQYTIQGSTLIMQVKDEGSRDLHFEVKDNILTVAKTDGSERSRFAPY